MNKKKPPLKRLRLKKETVKTLSGRQLDDKRLKQAIGGGGSRVGDETGCTVR